MSRALVAVPHGGAQCMYFTAGDSNNEAFTDKAIAALSSSEERGLWMEDPDGTVAMDFQGGGYGCQGSRR